MTTVVLKNLGGIVVSGTNAQKWANGLPPMIGSTLVEFDSGVSSPGLVNPGLLVLPCHRGQPEYNIHLLDSGELLVMKDGRIYFFTRRDNKPVLLTFRPVPSDVKLAQLQA